jgi:hypothetical protein
MIYDDIEDVPVLVEFEPVEAESELADLSQCVLQILEVLDLEVHVGDFFGFDEMGHNFENILLLESRLRQGVDTVLEKMDFTLS